MAEHHELVTEMSILEQMGTQERQKLAKKRRIQQLKKWSQREKEWIAKEKQINKRLANILHEENNGLNLKQYTSYSSNHRSKKKLQLKQQATGADRFIKSSNGVSIHNNNNNNTEFISNNADSERFSLSSDKKLDANLMPNGRVHFDVGVMLLEAAARNDFDEVKRLLMLGVSPDSVNHDGLTALHQCCIDNSEPIMNLLLEFGSNVDARDTEQWTPLHAACTCGHLNLVKILVDHGADLLAVNGDGNMPFDICEDEATLDYIESQMVKRNITQEMIDLTRASTEMQMISDLERHLAEGKDLNTANENGVTPLHVAAANGYLSVVKFLLKQGVNVNVCDNDYWRPLHGAACWGNDQHAKIVELLVEAGAQLDAKTINDETAFDLCDNVELLERLNQLKNELESKQASGVDDRLRRTQSRTNSRVHSVRRTSVRDKNQISRRDAREEAMLRVESTASVNETVKTTTQNGHPTENGTSTGGSPISRENSSDKSLSATMPSDQVDGSQVFKQTNLDALDDKAQSNSRGREQIEENRSSSHNPKERTNSLHESQSAPTLNRHQRQLSAPDQPQVTQSSINQSTAKVSSLSNGCLPVSHDRVVTSNMNTAEGQQRLRSGKSDVARDDNLHRQLQQPKQDVIAQAVIQIAPINYTLSNLKKQRSDLRMRTSSIGGVSSVVLVSSHSVNGISSSATTNNATTHATFETLAPNGQQVALEPEPIRILNGSSGHHRPESPSLSFRKFRGEPSESICGNERKGRHKCCIVT